MKTKKSFIFLPLLASTCLFGEVEHAPLNSLLNRLKNQTLHSQKQDHTLVGKADEIAIRRMSRYRNKLDRLKSQGVKESELNRVLGNAALKGEGIIRGTVFENDGTTPILSGRTIFRRCQVT